MEKENSIPSQANPPIQQTQPAAENLVVLPTKTSLIPLIITGFILIILFGVGGYYLGNKSKDNRNSIESVITQTNISPTVEIKKEIIKPTASTIKVSNIPADWSLNQNKTCGVSYYLPPAKEPYYSSIDRKSYNLPEEKKYWESHEDKIGYPPFKMGFSISLPSIPGARGLGISVICADNTNNLTTDSLLQEIQVRKKEEYEKIEVIQRKEIPLWGFQTYVISYLNMEMVDPEAVFYILATPKHIYQIDKFEKNSGESASNIDINTIIFNNLKLE